MSEISTRQFRLTSREEQILYLISHGHTSSEIAKKLHLSRHTVITYRKILFKKLQADNAPLLVRKGFELGLLNRSRRNTSLLHQAS